MFGVSIDELFHYENVDDKRIVREILEHIDEAGNQTDLASAEQICCEGLKQFPRSYELKCKMAVILKTKYLIAKTKDPAWLDEAIDLCDEVIHKSRDAKLIHTAAKTKAISQAYKGNKTEALITARDVIHDNDNLLVYILDGSPKIEACKNEITVHLEIIRKMLRLIAKVYKNQGNHEMHEKYTGAAVSLSVELND